MIGTPMAHCGMSVVMNVRQRLQDEYASALLEHIANADEAALNRAYELGRRILGEGFGVLDQVMLHNDAFGRIIAGKPMADIQQDLDRSAAFLAESLSAFEMSLRGYRDANARLDALHDALEQKVDERTRELTVASKVKDEFLAMVSHELRTPLTSINAVIGLLSAQTLGQIPAAMSKSVRLAQRNCERLMKIVDDLLDLTRIARGTFDLTLQSVELEPILLHVVDSRRVNPEAQSVTFAIADCARGLRVAADPPRLQQVLDNLLTNAAKFSDAKSTIEVGVERSAAGVRVAVTDHGIGIPAEYHDHVFKPFAQVDSSSIRARGGVGLGLSIVKAIVEAHRGTIEFSSAKGIGTTFYFELPVEPA